MAFKHIQTELKEGVAYLTLNRAPLNWLNIEMMEEINAYFESLMKERTLKLLVIQALGKAFSSGHDLSEMTGRTITDYRRTFDVCTELMTRIQSIPQPVIAQVQGIATAAGCQLVATCDLAVASSEATFATPGVKI